MLNTFFTRNSSQFSGCVLIMTIFLSMSDGRPFEYTVLSNFFCYYVTNKPGAIRIQE